MEINAAAWMVKTSPWSLREYPPIRDHFLSRLEKKFSVVASFWTMLKSGGFCIWNVDNWAGVVVLLLSEGAVEHGWHGVVPDATYSPQLSSASQTTGACLQFLQQTQLPSDSRLPNCRHCLQVVGHWQLLWPFLHLMHVDLAIGKM